MPQSAWPDNEVGSGFRTGLVFEYFDKKILFRISFSNEPEHSIVDTWDELLGVQACPSGECARLHTLPGAHLKPKPATRPPQNAAWDPRAGVWISLDGTHLQTKPTNGAFDARCRALSPSCSQAHP